jgi:hypothetical protein
MRDRRIDVTMLPVISITGQPQAVLWDFHPQGDLKPHLRILLANSFSAGKSNTIKDHLTGALDRR